MVSLTPQSRRYVDCLLFSPLIGRRPEPVVLGEAATSGDRRQYLREVGVGRIGVTGLDAESRASCAPPAVSAASSALGIRIRRLRAARRRKMGGVVRRRNVLTSNMKASSRGGAPGDSGGRAGEAEVFCSNWCAKRCGDTGRAVTRP